MIEGKIIEDPQAPLHVGQGRLLGWLRNKMDLLPLDTYDDRLCIFRCIAMSSRGTRSL